jgi:putative transcriptional regulator
VFARDYMRLILAAAAAIVLPAAALHAALSTGTDGLGRTSFAGQLLIASPNMRDPFDHAVILMAQHNREGALGIIINRPMDRRSIARVREALGATAGSISDGMRVFRGGPVSPNTVLVLHSADYHRPDTLDIDGRIALSDAADVLRDMALGNGPAKSLIALGYAGWGPSQLEDEIARGTWAMAPENPALVFDDDRSRVWTDALALLKTDR